MLFFELSSVKGIIIIAVMIILNLYIAYSLNSDFSTDTTLQNIIKEKDDTNKIRKLVNNSMDLYYQNPELGLKFGNLALELSLILNNKLFQAISYNSIAVNCWAKSDYPEALKYYFKALNINEELNNQKGIADNSQNIGLVYQNKKELDKAEKYYNKAFKIYSELNNKAGMAINLGNLGNLYLAKGDYLKALESHEQALKIDTELDRKADISADLTNIGIVLNAIRDYHSAYSYFSDALEIDTELDNFRGLASGYGNLGMILLQAVKDTTMVIINNQFISANKRENLTRSIDFLNKSLFYIDKIGDINFKQLVYAGLSDAYELIGEYQKSLSYYRKHVAMKDSIFSMENTRFITELETKRDQDIAAKQIQIQELQIAKQSLQNYFLILGIIFLIIIVVLIYLQHRKSEKLISNMLPKSIADRLKTDDKKIADRFESASVIFIDIVNFTELHSFDRPDLPIKPEEIVNLLNKLYTEFDKLAEKFGLEKIKTIGDCYMAAAGVPIVRNDHAKIALEFAIEAMKINRYNISFRCGIDCGPVIAGVIGEKKFIYDLWGDTVNTASRMEEYGERGKIHVTERFKNEIDKMEIGSNLSITDRGLIEIKGKGIMRTFLIDII